MPDPLSSVLTASTVGDSNVTVDHSRDLHQKIHHSFILKHSLEQLRRTSKPADMWCTTQIPDDVWWRSVATHATAHAVLGVLLGAELVSLTLVANSRQMLAPASAHLKSVMNAQLYAVHTLGGSHAHARWLAEQGYTHRQLRWCVLRMTGYGQLIQVRACQRQGLLIDRRRAAADALRMLAEPRTAAAHSEITDRLLNTGSVPPATVHAILKQHETPTPTDVWAPTPEEVEAWLAQRDR